MERTYVRAHLPSNDYLPMPLKNLNQSQFEAVKHTDGPLLVLAGAGTGKTRVLTSRVINIINSNLASPFQILAVTFTNKAAAEIKKRIGESIGEQTNNLWVGTFHSVAAKILRRHPEVVGLRSDFTIIDEDDQNRLLKQVLSDLNIDVKQFPTKFYLNKISRLKDRAITPQKVGNEERDLQLPKFQDVYTAYQSRLRSMNATDFGDLLLFNLEIFANSPGVIAYYQDKFRYILVDEYQDTNNTQYQWLLRLAAIHKNICCVGDDDQSIYSWRGANVANILRFEKDFADARVIRLEQNYRSTSNILAAADSVISNNKERHGKTLWTDVGQGEKVKIYSFLDDRMEASSIAATIKKYLSLKKFQPQQIAVLVRAGYQTRAFEEAFIQASISYKVIGGMKFYDRMEIRDAIAYLRVCANPTDDLALSRIINVPKRGCGDTAIANLYEKSKQEGSSFFSAIQKSIEDNSIKGRAKDGLKTLIEQLQKWRERIFSDGLSSVAKSILTEVGYIQMWRSENNLEAQGRLENIEEFINSLADFSSVVEFLEYISLVEARDDKSLQDAISVMTVHGAKGLEFDLVFVPGLEDGVFPSSKSIESKNGENKQGLEEERRLMYVAITRAKKELVLSYAKSRYVYGDYQTQTPSRFLDELPKADVSFEEIYFGSEFSSRGASSSFGKSNYANSNGASSSLNNRSKTYQSSSENSFAGKRIFHQKFGYGKVVNADGSKLTIDFEKSGTKVVMKDFINFA